MQGTTRSDPGRAKLAPTAFQRVTLPLLRHAFLAAVVMTWSRALGEFGAVLMLAGATRLRTETRPLTPEEAIGSPERRDYPILKGKEVMLEALFHDYRGQAFTDMPGNFTGTLGDVLALPLVNNKF